MAVKKTDGEKKKETPKRFRSARSDASIATIRTQIEKDYGFPAGSVQLVKPDGEKIRGNASVGTLKKLYERLE